MNYEEKFPHYDCKLTDPMSFNEFNKYIKDNSEKDMVALPYNSDAIDNLMNKSNPVSMQDYLNKYVYLKNQHEFCYLNGSNKKPDNDRLYIFFVFDSSNTGKEYRCFVRHRNGKKCALDGRPMKYSRTDKVAFVYDTILVKEFKRLARNPICEDDIIESIQINPEEGTDRTTGTADENIHHTDVYDLIRFNSKQ